MNIYGGSDGKESACSARDLCSIPRLGRSPGKGNGYPLLYSCLENPHGQRSLVGHSPWDHKELDTTEQLTLHFFIDECIRYETLFLHTCVCVCVCVCVCMCILLHILASFSEFLTLQTSGITHCHLYNPMLSLLYSFICSFSVSLFNQLWGQ